MEHYGVKEAISMCKGMFAIALYDREERVLYLLRDRIGEKPLYYGFVNGSFVFASDIGSIAALDGFKMGSTRMSWIFTLYMVIYRRLILFMRISGSWSRAAYLRCVSPLQSRNWRPIGL